LEVRSINKSDTTNWSPTSKFTTKLNAPILLSPNNNSFNNDTIVEFSWEAVDNSNECFLQIAFDSSFQNHH